MAELKTKPGDESVDAFLDAIADEGRRADCRALVAIMQQITGEPPVMWGTMVGFGRYRYRYESGRTGEWFVTGFSPRKGDLTLYLGYLPEASAADPLLAGLGRHKRGKGCLYLRRLADVDPEVLRQIIARGVEGVRKLDVDRGGGKG